MVGLSVCVLLVFVRALKTSKQKERKLAKNCWFPAKLHRRALQGRARSFLFSLKDRVSQWSLQVSASQQRHFENYESTVIVAFLD